MKKGQITVFIIIGLMLLVALFMIFYIRSKVINDNLVPELDTVSTEYQQVQEFVVQCISQVGTEALVKAGEHGGYIDPTDPELSKRSFDFNPMPTSSDVVYLTSEYMIPYWWYMPTPPECTRCEVSNANIPTILDIQDQINTYMQRNLPTCLSDLEEFKAQGYEIEIRGDMEIRTIIEGDHVTVYVNYPLRVNQGGKSTTLENFPVEIDVPFLKIYGLALSIADAEKDYQYLETITMHLVSAYSGLDTGKLPPLAAFTEGPGAVIWFKTPTMLKLRDLLRSYVGFIQVENTKGYVPVETGGLKLYDVFTLESNRSYPDTNVNFAFLDWPMHFDITPRRGELLEGSSYERDFPFGIAPSITTNHYEFFYDVSYPIIYEIRNDEAFAGLGYSFVVAMEANIQDNKNLALWHLGEGTYGPLDYSQVSYGYSAAFSPTPVQKYVPETDTFVNITKNIAKKKLFCKDSQRISGDIELTVLDVDSREPVGGADIIFGCGEYSKCNVGMTDDEGKFTGKFPVCVGEGYINIEKDGYGPFSRGQLTIRPDDRFRQRYTIERLKTVVGNVGTIPIDSLSGNIGIYEALQMQSRAKELGNSEQVMLSIRKIKDEMFEPDFIQVLTFRQNDTFKIKLVEGKYEVSANLVDMDGLNIPAHEESVYGSYTADVPDINMTIAPLGGVVINEDNGPWLVNRRHLQNPYVDFFILKSKAPTNMEELERVDDYNPYSTRYRTVINPRFRPR